MQLDKVCVEVLHILEDAAAVLAHRHDVADELLRRHDGGLDVGLARLLDDRRVGVIVRVVTLNDRAVGLDDFVGDGGERGDKVEVELALEALLNDLHVQHTEKAAPEAEAERDRRLRLERERGGGELELFERVAQVGVL